MISHRILISVLLICSIYNSHGQKSRLIQKFPISTPERQGISSKVLDSMMRFIKNSNQNIHHLTIIRNEHTVLDADFYPYSSQYLHDIASVTKSITSLLIGIAIDKGFIKDENEYALKFFPEISSHKALADSMRIKDLVSMSSGLDCSVYDGEKALSDMRKTNDWVRFIFELQMISKPGEKFSYCSCNFYLLAEILFRTTGLQPHEFAKKYLFAPLQIYNSKWLANYKDINHGWGDLFLLPADMAKIGELVLKKGKWEDKQVVSASWIAKCIHPFYKVQDDKGYGYGWWTNDKVGYYEAAGRGRQTISIVPSKGMVVVMLGGEFDAGTIGRYIFRSIHADNSATENKKDITELRETTRKAGLPLSPDSGFLNQKIAEVLKNKTIILEKNITSIDSMQLNFVSNSRGEVIFYKSQTHEKYPFILSQNIYEISMDPVLQLPVALKAISNGKEFILHYNQLCRINNIYFHFLIEKDGIRTRLEETSNSINLDIPSSFHTRKN